MKIYQRYSALNKQQALGEGRINSRKHRQSSEKIFCHKYIEFCGNIAMNKDWHKEFVQKGQAKFNIFLQGM